jgi:hypothetical protein
MRNQFLIGLAVAATIVFPYAQDGGAAEMGYAPQVSNEREIKVTATLQAIRNEAKTLDFEVVLETHTQPLRDDLAKSAALIADGKQYLPSEWEDAPPGGHHRKGMLRFKAIVPRPAAVELQIRLSGDPSPRSFKWLLK